MQASEATSDPKADGDRRIVLRNTLYLGIAEVLSMPISILLNAMMGHFLGPEALGQIYLAGTIAGVSFLLIAWGHHGSLPAAVVLDRSQAGKLLGTSIAWRLFASVVAYTAVALGCYALGFTGTQQWAIGLIFLGGTFSTVVSALQETIRGFERTDIAAYSRVGQQFAAATLVSATLLLGGGMRLTLAAQAVSVIFVMVPVIRALGSVGVGKLGWDQGHFKTLMSHGTAFAFFGLALVLQPNIDAFYLAKLSSDTVVGWYAVAWKLIGVLLVPASALIGGLYPTLCRLRATDMDGFKRTTRGAISAVSLLAVPVALSCALYPDIGVAIFGRKAFRPAEDTLTFASYYLFLVYFSMPIGTALIAAGRQRIWAIIQLVCVLNSAILDPIMIGLFQEHYGNGGIGLGVTAGISESIMVIAGIALMPSGVFERGLARTLGLAALSGAAMTGCAMLLRGLHSLLAAPIALAAYVLAAYLTGAISRQQIAEIVGFVRRKLGRAKS
jgi:O-antigen/teichoic acid export membrane protein